MYSVLAGFVESGETLEQAVHREVFEEVGIKVKNLKYFGSQPWPFPHSLMMGYTAEYAGGEITICEDEILAADWFTLETMPETPPTNNGNSNMSGGGLFDRFFGKKKNEESETENTVNTESQSEGNKGSEENKKEKEYKSIDDFMNVVQRNNIPQDYVNTEEKFNITDYPTNLSQNKYCQSNLLPTELEFSTTGPYGKYFENYNLFKKHYTDYNEKLLKILMSEILTFEDNIYKIKQLDSDALFEIEKKTRQTLLEYYIGSQKLFTEGFTSLVDGVESSLADQKKRKIKEELNKL